MDAPDNLVLVIIDVKKVVYEFFRFLSYERFYFLIKINLLNSYLHKRLLSDGFNLAATRNSLMKSRSSQTLPCTL